MHCYIGSILTIPYNCDIYCSPVSPNNKTTIPLPIINTSDQPIDFHVLLSNSESFSCKIEFTNKDGITQFESKYNIYIYAYV